MKSMFSLSIAVAAMLAGSCAATDSILDSMLNAVLVGRQDTTYQWEGCYSDPGSMEFNSTSIYQSKKTCHDVCAPMNMSVEATTDKTSCWCGNSLPSNASLVDISKCNAPCVGYPAESCGGVTFFSVYLTGVGTVKAAASPSASSTSSTSSSSPAAVVTVGGQTVVVTTGPTSSTVAKSSSNKAAIAAGVVVGLVAFAALVGGGAFLWNRRRKIRHVEEEYRRNAAVSEFVAGGKTHSGRSGSSFSDNRLDPTVMGQRRMSDGSIADNQDYSRRILKVTNA